MPSIKQTSFWPVWMLGLAMLTLILLAAGFATFELRPGQPLPYGLIFGNGQGSATPNPALRLPASFIEMFMLLGMLALIGLLLLWLMTFILRPQARKYMLRRIVAYFTLLLILYAFLEGFRRLAPAPQTPTNDSQAEVLAEVEPPPEELPTPPAFVVNPPWWLTGITTLMIFSLFLGLLWLAWQRGQRLHAAGIMAQKPLAMLVEEARQSIAQLQQGHDLKQTILDCYRSMTQVLKEERGIERSRTMTARDFEQHVAELGFRDEHIQRLSRLFEKFRYGANEPSPQDEAEAIACLSAIVEAYSRPS